MGNRCSTCDCSDGGPATTAAAPTGATPTGDGPTADEPTDTVFNVQATLWQNGERNQLFGSVNAAGNSSTVVRAHRPTHLPGRDSTTVPLPLTSNPFLPQSPNSSEMPIIAAPILFRVDGASSSYSDEIDQFGRLRTLDPDKYVLFHIPSAVYGISRRRAERRSSSNAEAGRMAQSGAETSAPPSDSRYAPMGLQHLNAAPIDEDGAFSLTSDKQEMHPNLT